MTSMLFSAHREPFMPSPFGTTGQMSKGERQQPRYGNVPKIAQRCPAAG
jgi:hypothetical protein